jgi:hypothetical protein
VLGAVSVDCAPHGPGLIVLDDDQMVLTMTSHAERWLDELRDGSPGLPNAIRSVVACVRELDHGESIDAETPRARVRGRSGRWLVIHGSRTLETDGRNPGTAIIIEEATPAEIAPIIVRAYGLSERETRVTRLILQGSRPRRSQPTCVYPRTRSRTTSSRSSKRSGCAHAVS